MSGYSFIIAMLSCVSDDVTFQDVKGLKNCDIYVCDKLSTDSQYST